MTLAHVSVSAGNLSAGFSKFPTYIDYNAHVIPIPPESRQGMPVISLNTVTHVVPQGKYSAPR
jgi:hypothetical protein